VTRFSPYASQDLPDIASAASGLRANPTPAGGAETPEELAAWMQAQIPAGYDGIRIGMISLGHAAGVPFRDGKLRLGLQDALTPLMRAGQVRMVHGDVIYPASARNPKGMQYYSPGKGWWGPEAGSEPPMSDEERRRFAQMLFGEDPKKNPPKRRSRKNPVGKTKKGPRGGWISLKGDYEHKRIRPPAHFVQGSFRTVPWEFASKAEQEFVKKKLKGKRITKGVKVITGRFRDGITRGRVKGVRVKYLGNGVQAVLFPLPRKNGKTEVDCKTGKVKKTRSNRRTPTTTKKPKKKKAAVTKSRQKRYKKNPYPKWVDIAKLDRIIVKMRTGKRVSAAEREYFERARRAAPGMVKAHIAGVRGEGQVLTKPAGRMPGQTAREFGATFKGSVRRAPAFQGLARQLGYRANSLITGPLQRTKKGALTAGARREQLNAWVRRVGSTNAFKSLNDMLNHLIVQGAPKRDIQAIEGDMRWLAKEHGVYAGELTAQQLSRLQSLWAQQEMMMRDNPSKGKRVLDLSERSLKAWVKKYRYDLAAGAATRRKALAKSAKAIGYTRTGDKMVSTAWHMNIAGRELVEVTKMIERMSKALLADSKWLAREAKSASRKGGKVRKNPGRLVILNPSRAHKATPAKGNDQRVLEDAASKMKGSKRTAFIKLVNESTTNERKLLAQALRRYHSLHGTYPTQIKKTDVKMPGKGKRFMVGIGKADHVGYHANKGYKGTKKSGTPWRHHFENNQELVTDEAGKSLAVIGKGTKVTDFIHG
jgi:hypothetical protein